MLVIPKLNDDDDGINSGVFVFFFKLWFYTSLLPMFFPGKRLLISSDFGIIFSEIDQSLCGVSEIALLAHKALAFVKALGSKSC